MKEIPLTQGKVALVDDEDYKTLKSQKWHARCSRGLWYASSHPHVNIVIHMHNLLLPPQKGFEIDHIDGDGLNNQKSNLRIVTHRQNAWNKHPKAFKKVSKYPGVSFNKQSKKWCVRYRNKEKMICGRTYLTEEEAYQAYLSGVRSIEND